MKMIKLFVDMDGVMADFYNSPMLEGASRRGYGEYPEMYREGFFFGLPPIPGAIEAVRYLTTLPNLEVWVLSQPVQETPHSYSEKVRWIKHYLPQLEGKIILTQEKEHLSAPGRVLVDDNEKKWGDKWRRQGGEFLHFLEDEDPTFQWSNIVSNMRTRTWEHI